MKPQLQTLLSETLHDFKLALNEAVYEDLLLQSIQLLERGTAVTIIIRSADEPELRDDLFLFNKCLIFLKKGGELYLSDAIDETLAVSDYKKGFRFKGVADDSSHEQQTQVQQHIRKFKELETTSQPFLEDAGDINIRFDVNDNIILKGDEVTLTWAVERASTVIIEGIGEVEASGSRKVRPGADTIFRIGAYNGTQTKLKTLGVSVYDNVHIDYDLSFSNIRTKQYSSLVKENNYPHVFGVARGNTVHIKWHVKDSNDVKVMPFGICSAAGEYEFLPEENMIIEIEARVFYRTFTRKIQLLVFPIKLFTQKLVNLHSDAHNELCLSSPDMSSIIDEIKTSQYTYSQSLENIRNDELKKYNSIIGRIQKITFDKSDNKFNLDEINQSVFKKLKDFYARKPGIIEVIESIKSYYGKA